MADESNNSNMKTSTKNWTLRISLLVLVTYLIFSYYVVLNDCNEPTRCIQVVIPISLIMGVLAYGIMSWRKPKSPLGLLAISIIAVATMFVASFITSFILFFFTDWYASWSH